MKPVSGARRHATVLAVLTVAFFGRVAGQAMQAWAPRPWLPPFEDFQGSDLPYGVLLASQVLILALMARATVRVWRGTTQPSAGVGRTLAWFGGIYLAGSVARPAVGLTVAAAPDWFRAWISGVFHLVLAGFVLTLAHYHRRARTARP